jgi:O-methyltransferase
MARGQDPAERYLDLIKGCLTRVLFGEPYKVFDPRPDSWKGRLYAPIRAVLARRDYQLVKRREFDERARVEGRDWPAEAETMIGRKRLDNLHWCIREVLREGVEGDFMECGVWRGGAGIFMRAALEAYGDPERSVWLADSFRGLPPPDPERYPRDHGIRLDRRSQLAVSLDEVKRNFARYDLLDTRVHFLEGWFRDTLPAAPVERLSILRLDGDLYESTIQALDALFPKLSRGGFAIIDDYNAVPACRAAVDEYRESNGVHDELVEIDWSAVFWRVGG